MILRAAGLALTALVAGACVAWAEPAAVQPRSGDHEGFGRIVLDLPAGCASGVQEDGDEVRVALTGPCAFVGRPRPPRNVTRLDVTSGVMVVRKVPGGVLRRSTLGARLVLDFPDRAPAKAVEHGQGRRPSAPAILSIVAAHDRRESLTEASPPVARHAEPLSPPPVAQLPPVVRQAAAEPPRRAAPAEVLPRGTALIPAEPEVGAAAFRRNGSGVVLFDTPQRLDAASISAALGRPARVAAASGAAALFEVPLSAGEGVYLKRRGDGWLVSLRDRSPVDGKPIAAEEVPGGTLFHLDTPGRVIDLADGETGARTLIGTSRESGALMPQARRLPDYAVDGTWLGMVLRPAAASIELQPVQGGFLLRGAAGAGPATAVGLVAGASPQSRMFDFPPLPTEALWRRLQALRAAADSSRGAARGAGRTGVAEGMLALGMAAEAQAVLDTVAAEAGGPTDARFAGLRAVAAVLTGRVAEAAAIEIPNAAANDEVSLWRALAAASAQPGAEGAASAIAGNLDLIAAYPDELRDKVLPLAMAGLIDGGERAAAARLLERFPEQPGAALARAQLLMGDPDPAKAAGATALLQAVAEQGDRRARSRAAGMLVERQLTDHAIGPAEAAERLMRTLYAWRGDDLEYARRLRIAELQDAAGQGRSALGLLRETLTLWPDRRADVQPRLTGIFEHAAARDPAGADGSVAWLTLIEENADLWPTGEAGATLGLRTATQLMRLDLPERAGASLQRVLASGVQGPLRAEAGVRLAAIRQRQGDPAGALDALNGSTAPDLEARLAEERDLAFARAAATLGDVGTARATLARLGSDRALETGAGILEQAEDWGGVADLLGTLLTRRDTGGAVLPAETATLVLRLAGAVSRIGEPQRREALRARFLNRLSDDRMNGTFDFLTATPVGAVSDIGRAGVESRLAKALPSAISGLGGAAPRL